MRRGTLLFTVLAGLVLLPAGPAAAHGGDAPDATAYRIEVTGLSAPQPGLTVRVVEAGARLELTNDTPEPVEVLGYSGEPYLEVRPDGTYQNVNSPATYLNETLAGDSPVPSHASAAAAPQWERVSGDRTVRWHDQRTQWLSADLPPQAQADPSRPHELRAWVVPLRRDVVPFEVHGTLTWEPPPTTWAWWLGAAGLGAAVVALGLRRFRWVGAVTLIAGTTTFGYAVTRAVLGLPGQAPAIGAAALAVAAGVLTLRGRTPFLAFLGGTALVIFGGLGDAGVLTQAVVDFPGPGWLPRVAVSIALGAGAGAAVAALLRLRSPVVAPISSGA
ncbi:hypothetical protein [Actinoplanes sp. NPDC051859]|uniref:hypothetical protein n=1 Tax=Actinoplanes sp. NPDC051859 TaxID=3363909 RepID=UPI0037BADC40